MTMATESSESGIKMRSIYVSSLDDAEFQSGLAARATRRNTAQNSVSSDGDHFNEHDSSHQEEHEDALDPIQLPQSTHSLFFSEPIFSLPFAFALGISFMSFACLALAFADSWSVGNLPANVTWGVRCAQYLAILITLLMEEEIPTGLYLLRMIPRQSLHQKFPKMKYTKFIFSSVVRIFSGYYFLMNVILVLIHATGVIEIFYDVLALQFVQQLDDIAFNLAKMNVFGKRLQRACVAECFRAEFEKKRFHKKQKLSIFLKAIYFVNVCGMFLVMGSFSVHQLNGGNYDDSITVNFGNTVWETAWVTGEDKPRILVYSYFNGVYTKKNELHRDRPVYVEMRKSDQTHFEEVVPAKIQYCDDIEGWVFIHPDISKKKSGTKEGCNWLLRSPKTTEFDLLDVVGDWQVWTGVIGKAEVSIASNICHGDTDCNLNGRCNKDGKCECEREDDTQYFGTHCEVRLEDSCETITGERFNESYSVTYMRSLVEDYTGPHDAMLQSYSRPVFSYVEGNPEIDYTLSLIGSYYNTTFSSSFVYSGNRWFYGYVAVPDAKAVEKILADVLNYHAFWSQAYSNWTRLVSDPSESSSTPVGVDFYYVGEQGKQFGPFGALYPIQLYNQTGRGHYRCGWPIPAQTTIQSRVGN